MAIYVVDGNELTAIASAVRAKGGTMASMTLSAMKTAIYDMSIGYPATSNSFATLLYGMASSIDGFMSYNETLESVYLSNCRTVEEYAFGGCSNLKTVSLPVCTTVGSNAFYNTAISEINLPSCTYVDVEAFDSCHSLTSVSLPRCTYVNDSAFTHCTSLQSIELPACMTINDNVFSDCTALTTVSLPVCSYIGSSAFANCQSLTSLYLLSSSVVDVYGIHNLFATTSPNIYIPSGMISTYLSTHWALVYSYIYDMNGEWAGDYYDPTQHGYTSESSSDGDSGGDEEYHGSEA